MLEFIIARANYWAIIGLMMVGLYIVFQSENFIKKLVGLSIFQTSVFFFYITLGKVAGGSAPILYGGDLKKGHGEDHGGVHGEDHAVEGAIVTGEVHAAEPATEPVTDLATGSEQFGGYETGAPQGAYENVIKLPDTVLTELVNPALGLEQIYSNPLPHVLILTAIVVGVATLAVGLALVVRIREAYGSIETRDVDRIDIETADRQDADEKDGAIA